MQGDLVWFASALGFAVSVTATPGPNNAMIAASGANFGFRRTLPHMLGVSIGFPVMLLLVALGGGEVLRAQPLLQQALRWAGVAYLLWLAFRIAVVRPEIKEAPGGRGSSATPLTFVQAALFQWLNPKAWVIAAGAAVTYTTGGDHLLIEAGGLAALFLIVCLPVTALWTGVGVGAARMLREPRALRAFNLVMAALLVASLIPLLSEGHGATLSWCSQSGI